MGRSEFGREYFSSGSYDEYESEIARWVPKVARKIARILSQDKANILDIGCAQGYLIAELQNKYNYEVSGIDYSVYAVKNANKTIRKKVQQGDILNLPYKKNSFDAVICLDVINYLSKEEVSKAVRNLVKATRKYIFFGAIFQHAWTASQKWNPDKLRKSMLRRKEYIDYFRKAGAEFIEDFDGDNGGRILVFQKIEKNGKAN